MSLGLFLGHSNGFQGPLLLLSKHRIYSVSGSNTAENKFQY